EQREPASHEHTTEAAQDRPTRHDVPSRAVRVSPSVDHSTQGTTPRASRSARGLKSPEGSVTLHPVAIHLAPVGGSRKIALRLYIAAAFVALLVVTGLTLVGYSYYVSTRLLLSASAETAG